MYPPMVVLEFSGVAPNETLRSLGSEGVVRIDPLAHDPEPAAGLDAFVHAQAGSLIDGAYLVAYCTGATLAVAIANLAWRLHGSRIRLVLLDPIAVSDSNIRPVLRKFWNNYTPNPEEAAADIETVIALAPADAARETRSILEPRVVEQLRDLGIGEEQSSVVASELVRRYQQWVSFLLWSRSATVRLDGGNPVTTVVVDPARAGMVIEGSSEQEQLLLPYDPDRYLAHPDVAAAIRSAVSN